MTFEPALVQSTDLPKKSDPQLSALQLPQRRQELRRAGFRPSTKRSLPATVSRPGLHQPALRHQRARPDQGPSGLERRPAPDLIGAAYFTQERERKGGPGARRVQAHQGWTLTFTGFSSKMDADSYNRNYLIAPRAGLINSATISNYQVVTDRQGRQDLTQPPSTGPAAPPPAATTPSRARRIEQVCRLRRQLEAQ